jgi:hypothetical protein
MPSGYVVGRTPAGTALTIALVAGIATARPSVHQLIVSSDSAPADIATKFQLLRHTAAAVGGTALVAKASDPGNTSLLCTALQGTMTEPTYEANGELEFSVNQRATYTWIANPGREIKSAVGTANGLGVRSISSGATPNINCTIAWDE